MLVAVALGAGVFAAAVVLGVYRAEDGRVTREAVALAVVIGLLGAAGVYAYGRD